MLNGRLVFFDVETGGLDPARHPIIQIAAIAVSGSGEKVEAFERKLQFQEQACDAEALKINHYDREVWARDAVPATRGARDFSGFLERHASIEMFSKRTQRPYSVARLAGHNAASFDGPFVQAWFRRQSIFLPADPRVRCTLQRAIWWFDERGEEPSNYKLATLCEYFDIPLTEAHDALADVWATVQLAKALSGSSRAAA